MNGITISNNSTVDVDVVGRCVRVGNVEYWGEKNGSASLPRVLLTSWRSHPPSYLFSVVNVQKKDWIVLHLAAMFIS